MAQQLILEASMSWSLCRVENLCQDFGGPSGPQPSPGASRKRGKIQGGDLHLGSFQQILEESTERSNGPREDFDSPSGSQPSGSVKNMEQSVNSSFWRLVRFPTESGSLCRLLQQLK